MLTDQKLKVKDDTFGNNDKGTQKRAGGCNHPPGSCRRFGISSGVVNFVGMK